MMLTLMLVPYTQACLVCWGIETLYEAAAHKG